MLIDFSPFSFGGNKVRIAWEFFKDMEERDKDCMIFYGNARLNLSRVIANISSARGNNCHIISPTDDDGSQIETTNSKIVHACGAVFHTCPKTNVADTVQSVIDDCSKAGLKPYYIYGDRFGKGNEAVPVRAYVKVYEEILQQENDLGIKFNYIFHASGTGMTQTFLISGQLKYGGNAKNVGISEARKAEQEKTDLHCQWIYITQK